MIGEHNAHYSPTSIIHVGNYEFTQRLETHQFTILKNQFNI